MASLFETTVPATTDRRALPAEIRQAILALQAEYTPLRPNAIATICQQRFHRPVSHHTVRAVLAGAAAHVPATRRFPRYRDIAGYLATKRDRVYAALRRWFAEGLPGLEDQSRAPQHPCAGYKSIRVVPCPKSPRC